MSEWLDMGKYAAHVWGSLALTAVVLAWNVLAARRRHADALRRARERLGAGRQA